MFLRLPRAGLVTIDQSLKRATMREQWTQQDWDRYEDQLQDAKLYPECEEERD